jgi:hypothetical protein
VKPDTAARAAVGWSRISTRSRRPAAAGEPAAIPTGVAPARRTSPGPARRTSARPGVGGVVARAAGLGRLRTLAADRSGRIGGELGSGPRAARAARTSSGADPRPGSGVRADAGTGLDSIATITAEQVTILINLGIAGLLGTGRKCGRSPGRECSGVE